MIKSLTAQIGFEYDVLVCSGSFQVTM